MKILLTITNAHRIVGGAAITCATLLRHLEEDYGHECRMFSKSAIPVRRQVEGFELSTYRDLEELKLIVSDWQPDMIIGALSSALDSTRLARHFGIPGFVYFLSFEFSEPSDKDKLAWGIPEQASFSSAEETAFVLDSADRVFVCSRYLQELPSLKGAGAEILYPEFDLNSIMIKPEFKEPSGAITGICGFRHKGIEIFIELAAAFPSEPFMLVGEIGSDIDPRYRERLEQMPNMTLSGRIAPADFLAKSRIVVVPSQWPEPFGRIAVEALANGVPVLVSQCGGLCEIVEAPEMLVEEFRDLSAWVVGLRKLLDASPEEIREASSPSRFFGKSATQQLNLALNEANSQRTLSDKSHVVFNDEGGRSAFSLVNSAWSTQLEASGFEVVNHIENDFDCPDFFIHHNYSVSFMDFVPPETGKCIAVRTWDFGRFPKRWVQKINAEFDQFWAYSEWIREQALASGIEPDRIRVVPLGIDPALHTPEGEVFPLPLQKRFVFGFVGGAVVRKGIDILLKAYGEAFTSEDDVCLVVKDHSKDIFYLKSDYREEIRKFVENPDSPALIYIDEFLSDEELASLYRSFDIGVFPYRAEGFCKPILETMACGVPSLVPNLGPCVDFCTAETSYLMPVLRVNLPVNRRMDLNLGFEEHIEEVDFCEVRVDTLAKFMRQVYESSPVEIERKSLSGIEQAHGNYTWEHSGQRVAELLRELDENPVPIRLSQAREENSSSENKAEIARRLFQERSE